MHCKVGWFFSLSHTVLTERSCNSDNNPSIAITSESNSNNKNFLKFPIVQILIVPRSQFLSALFLQHLQCT